MNSASDSRPPLKQDILIVDDTLDNLRFLSTMLVQQGYEVRKAVNGFMALTAVKAMPPSLILLDIMMPGLNGYEVCKELKSDPETAAIPVIFLSALDDVFDKVKAFAVGGVDYITKPFQFEEVLVRVKNHLALREAELENQRLNAELEARVKERTHQLELANEKLQQEINERQKVQAKLLEMALHDPLTGLPNRVLFMEKLEQALEWKKSNADYIFAVLFLDCDRFKVVNDSLGHLVGDELLISISRRLETCLESGDTFARLGGDEFAILVEGDRGVQVAEAILQKFIQPFQLKHHEVFINASIGIALSEASDEQPEYLLRDADNAMYRAKEAGKAQYRIFDSTMHISSLELLELETDLRKAVNHNEFVLYYQPIINLKTGKIAGFEALTRWLHPQRGLVSPGDFIPIAEETGLIIPLGRWVLEEACWQLREWQKLGQIESDLFISVNLSVRQFSRRDLVQQIDQILASVCLAPPCLKLEITESVIMDKDRGSREILEQLSARSIQLSIDDFGTGYSSLSYLHSFPVNSLKIDKSFISRLRDNTEELGLVPAIINLAKTMKISAIAEGVETETQLAILRDLQCDFGQGYFFSKPLDAQNVLDLIVAAPTW